MRDKIVKLLTTKQGPRVAGELCGLASAAAPFIYFDRAPNFGFNGAAPTFPSKRRVLWHLQKARML